MSVWVLWFEGNNEKTIIGLFQTKEAAEKKRMSYDKFDRGCLSITEEEVDG